MRLGGGVGHVSFSGPSVDGDASVSGLGSIGALALGGTPADGLVIGGLLRFAGATGTLETDTLEVRNATGALALLGVFVDWYPDPGDGWHVGGTAGPGFVSLDSHLPEAGGVAFAGAVFGGYDWWIGPEWSLGLQAVLGASTRTDLRTSDADDIDIGYRLGAVFAGLEYGITLH
jgi:hypothetical protein